jgi:hypothetical protein
MIIEFNLTQIIFIAIALVSGLWAVAKYIARIQERAVLQGQEFFKEQFSSHEKSEFDFHTKLDKRMNEMHALHRSDAVQWQRVERELLTLKADMPVLYVRREDYIRGQSTLEAKLDGLGMKIENAQFRALKTN